MVFAKQQEQILTPDAAPNQSFYPSVLDNSHMVLDDILSASNLGGAAGANAPQNTTLITNALENSRFAQSRGPAVTSGQRSFSQSHMILNPIRQPNHNL